MDRNRSNPFSIDYILSSQQQQQQHSRSNLDSPQVSHADDKQPQHLPVPLPQALPQTHPNFIYFIACMLLQQRQQQQQQQLQQQLAQQPHQLTSRQLLQHHPLPQQRLLVNPLLQAPGSFGAAHNQVPQPQQQNRTSPPTSPVGATTAGDHHNLTAHLPEKLDSLKPAHSYIGLIGMCILSSPDKRMVLNDIYQFILDNYPYYRNRGSGWRNSVRHNLSLNECFQKAGRAANGKGHYWTIHPANMQDFMMGDFRRRRAQRKVRRWNNMDVPSDESDDESMDDVNKPPLPEHFKRSIEMHKRLELNYHKSALMAAAAAAAVAASQQQPSNPSPIDALEAATTAAAGPNHQQSPSFHLPHAK